MEFSCIFPGQFSAGVSSYVLAAFIGSVVLYYAVHFFNLRRIIDNLYSLASHHEIIDRTQFHFLIVMFPFIIVIFISIFYNHSLIGIEISMSMDEISIFVVTGYIYWVDQSKQTPLRGFIFIRDMIFFMGSFAIFCNVYYAGQTNIYEGIAFALYYLVFYFFQNISSKVEELLLKVLGLKQRKIYTTKQLLSSKKQTINPEIIKEIITNNSQQIKQEIQQFQNMADTIVQQRHQRRILINFSKIFVAIRKARQIHEQNLLDEAIEKEKELWEEEAVIETSQKLQEKNQMEIIEDKQLDHEDLEDQKQSKRQSSMENSMDGINKTINKQYSEENESAVDIIKYQNQQDYVIQRETDDQAKQNTLFMKILKYSCYPIYLISLPQGRLRYFFDYVSLFIMIGCMFLITNSASYFSYVMSYNLTIVGIVTAILLCYPTISYYTQLSKKDHYDFLNIFIQAGIFKLFTASLVLSISSFINGFPVQDGINHLAILIFRALTYLVLVIYICTKHFNIQSTFFKFSIGTILISQISRVIIEFSLIKIK